MPFQKGQKLGGARKGTGPKPDWFKSWCAEAVYKESRLKRLEEVMDTGTNKEFLDVLRFCRETAFGKPKQELEHSGDALKRMVLIFPEENGHKQPGRS